MTEPATFTEAEVNAEAERLLVGKPPHPLCFVDIETSGLDPRFHKIWEIALIRREVDGMEREWVGQLGLSEQDFLHADPDALHVGGYMARHAVAYLLKDPQTAIEMVTEFTEGATLVGQNPSFDAAFLTELLMLPPGVTPPWHYRTVCVTTLAAGYVAGRLDRACDFAVLDMPWSSRDIAEAVDVDVASFAKHTALGDAQLARAIYDRVMG